MIPETVRAILAAIGLYALRRKCLLWRSLAMERSNVSRKLLVLNKYRQNAHCTVSARVVCIQCLEHSIRFPTVFLGALGVFKVS